jgi:hypothetical protein
VFAESGPDGLTRLSVEGLYAGGSLSKRARSSIDIRFDKVYLYWAYRMPAASQCHPGVFGFYRRFYDNYESQTGDLPGEVSAEIQRREASTDECIEVSSKSPPRIHPMPRETVVGLLPRILLKLLHSSPGNAASDRCVGMRKADQQPWKRSPKRCLEFKKRQYVCLARSVIRQQQIP